MEVVKNRANKNSLYDAIKAKADAATKPGIIIGTTMFLSTWR
jgi:hypothetical protein